MRCDEIVNMKVDDVDDIGNNKYLATIRENKNDYAGQFIIGQMFYDTITKYISLRPSGNTTDRFFVHYCNGSCTRQNIGRHKIGEIPKIIATFLNLENAKKYTGHCFRRTSATLLSESGANVQTLKQLGRWRSDMIAQSYIENSLHNRELIFDGVTHEAVKNKNLPITSANLNCTYSRPSVRNDLLYSRPSTSNDLLYSRPSTSNELFYSRPSTSTITSVNQNPTQSAIAISNAPEDPTSTRAMFIELKQTEQENYDLDWSDFADDMISKDLQTSSKFQI